jgi:FAD/FMN-containing dehydrogenase
MTAAPAVPAPSVRRDDIDWTAFAGAFGDIPTITEPALVKQKSRDFYWYSPVLKARLNRTFGDLVVCPRSEAEVVEALRVCARERVPVTVRGAGTGNYGQAMPLEGGVILELAGMDRLFSLDDGIARVEAGKKLVDLEEEALRAGWELRLFPSTRRTATIGGFVAGGSTGVGAINYGLLRDRGNVLSARVVTMEPEPRVLELEGDGVWPVIHAYGCNGVITELRVALAPAWRWADCVVAFADPKRAVRFAQALAESDAIVKRMITMVAGPVPTQYFKPLREVVPDGASVVMTMVAESLLGPFRDLVREQGGDLCFVRKAGEAPDVPPVYEFAWNHTTLQALKVDKTITYLQTLFPPPTHVESIEAMIDRYGDEVPMHVEFVRLHGKIAAFGLQLVRYTTEERLNAIIAEHEAAGCPIFNPHTYVLEDGGMKEIDELQLSFKRAHDPMGLLNPGKMRAWWERPAA